MSRPSTVFPTEGHGSGEGRDADSWDECYWSPAYIHGTEPNGFLVEEVARLPERGRILLPGDGEGRNSVWLAEQGFRPTSIDFSAVGLEKARLLAEARGVTIETVQADVTDWNWPWEGFDGAAVIFCQLPPGKRRLVHRALLGALRPGGRLLLEAHSYRWPAIGTALREYAYLLEELYSDFEEAVILSLREEIRFLAEGQCLRGRGSVIRLVAERPL